MAPPLLRNRRHQMLSAVLLCVVPPPCPVHLTMWRCGVFGFGVYGWELGVRGGLSFGSQTPPWHWVVGVLGLCARTCAFVYACAWAFCACVRAWACVRVCTSTLTPFPGSSGAVSRCTACPSTFSTASHGTSPTVPSVVVRARARVCAFVRVCGRGRVFCVYVYVFPCARVHMPCVRVHVWNVRFVSCVVA